MKCICGYIHYPENKICNNGAVIYANKPFVKMSLPMFTGFGEIDIYACPKCGTLKVEV